MPHAKKNHTRCRAALPCILGAALFGVFAHRSLAQNAPPLFLQGGLPLEQPSGDYKALPVGGWLLTPSLFAGAVYDSNVFQSPQQPVAASGFRIAPSLVANLNSGVHNTTLYGNLDGSFYSGAASEKNLVNGHAGISEVYEAQRDLVFNAQGDYSHQTSLFSNVVSNPLASSTVLPNAQSLLSPIATSPTSPSSQFTGLVSFQKTLNHGFVGFGTSVVHTSYQGLSSQDGTVTTVTGKAGYYLTPQLFAYVQPSFDWRNYATSSLNSRGYRVVGGLGSDQIGLFRGEIYGGYQAENYTTAPTTSSGGPIVGARLTYLPTPYWTLIASVDETLDVATQPNSPTNSLPSSVRTRSAILQSNYALSKMWTASGSLGWVEIAYLNNLEVDRNWLFDAKLNYSVWANLGFTLEYQYTAVTSNVPLVAYNRSVITAGISYKY